MVTGQDLSTPVYCPRCGGTLYKPSGSSLYWHANHNHPRCDITNLAMPETAGSSVDEPPAEPAKRQQHKKKK